MKTLRQPQNPTDMDVPTANSHENVERGLLKQDRSNPVKILLAAMIRPTAVNCGLTPLGLQQYCFQVTCHGSYQQEE